jgi:hypothetical protein
VRLGLIGETRPGAVLVPDEAIGTDRSNRVVYVVTTRTRQAPDRDDRPPDRGLRSSAPAGRQREDRRERLHASVRAPPSRRIWSI